MNLLDINCNLFTTILEYLCINNKQINICSKKFNNKLKKCKKCKVIFYKDLSACEIHSNYKLLRIVRKLNKAKENPGKVGSIHFTTKEELEIAKKYLSDFGLITKYCCNGKGVMYGYHYSKKIDIN
jgi:hypothetical protein